MKGIRESAIKTKEIEEITGLSHRKALNLVHKFGQPYKDYTILTRERFDMLLKDGVIERMKGYSKKGVDIDNLALREQVYNLTLFLTYVKDEYPLLWTDMNNRFSGLPGYAERLVRPND